jgi:hypothetical protein
LPIGVGGFNSIRTRRGTFKGQFFRVVFSGLFLEGKSVENQVENPAWKSEKSNYYFSGFGYQKSLTTE